MQRRVLIVVENLPMPFDTRVRNVACALHDAGYEVTVLSPRGKGYERNFEIWQGIRIYRHPMPAGGHGFSGYFKEYGAALFWEMLYTWWIVMRHGVNVIHGCNPPDTVFFVAWPLKLFGVRYIFDHHDLSPELFEAKYGRRGALWRLLILLERLSFRAANVCIATNNSYRNVARNRGGVSPDRIFVVRNGPDDEFRPVPAVPELKRGKRYLVAYVGTIAVQEGLDLLLGAARRLLDKGRDEVMFVCIGSGPALGELRALRDSLGLSSSFEFTGRISQRELLEILSTADVCVNPDTPNELNGMSTMIKIMEYMALGKPIVQFDLAEGRFSAGEAAVYAPSTDPLDGSLADKIEWLLDHPAEREWRGALGQQRVRDELAWKYSVPSLLAAYAAALGP